MTQDLIDEMDDLLKKKYGIFTDYYLEYCNADLILRTVYSFGLLSDLQRKISTLRKEENLLMISDTGTILNRVISQQEDAPFLFEKTGTRYQHYLLDEFQDTSDLQWENLRPLVLEGLSNGWESLVVGDVKQSIYRWRNGNMELLLKRIEEELIRDRKIVENRELKSNYRTSKDIVQFNNRFFEFALSHMAELFGEEDLQYIQNAYAGVDQVAEIQNIPGFVSLQFFRERRPRTDPPDTPTFAQQSLEATFQTIRKVKEEGFDLGDICILVREKKYGREVARYLQDRRIQVVSADSLLLISDPGVQLIHSLLRYLEEPGDEVNAAVLRYLGDVEERKNLGLHHKFTRKSDEEIPRDFLDSIPALKQLPVYESVEQILTLFPALSDPDPYILGFLDAVLEFSSAQQASVSGFLEWWEDEKNKRALASGPVRDAVQIITIHSAKGLEFPVVILPFLKWSIKPGGKDLLWVQTPDSEDYEDFPFLPLKAVSAMESTVFWEEYAEEFKLSHIDNLNLLYVALTRPQYRLYLFAPSGLPGDGKAGNVAHLLNLFFKWEGQEPGEESFREEGRALTAEEILELKGETADHRPEKVSLLRTDGAVQPWSQRIRIAKFGQRHLPTSTDARVQKIREGEWLHDVLSRIRTLEDIDSVLAETVASGEHRQESLEAMSDMIRNLLTRNDLADWFSGKWEVRNEADILVAGGGILRPDRVMIKDDHAVVLDYKSGEEKRGHIRQVQTYMRGLAAMGYATVEGYLLYLGSGKLQAVEL